MRCSPQALSFGGEHIERPFMAITSRVATIELAGVRPTKSNRPLSANHVRDLAESFAAGTFATAVIVRPLLTDPQYQFETVACFHRLEAARSTGQTSIHAIVVEDATDAQLELIQLDENLLHRSLTPAQEARAMMRKKVLYQELAPNSRRGGDRKSKDQIGRVADSFAEATAAATGRSITAINRAAHRGERITPEVLSEVQNTVLETGGFLDRLAKVAPDAHPL
jgi:hypothetical protein